MKMNKFILLGLVLLVSGCVSQPGSRYPYTKEVNLGQIVDIDIQQGNFWVNTKYVITLEDGMVVVVPASNALGDIDSGKCLFRGTYFCHNAGDNECPYRIKSCHLRGGHK